jgi:hypothetical protein
VLPGRVLRFGPGHAAPDGARLKVPHMGWNRVRPDRPHALWEGVPDGAYFYFVHSYFAAPGPAALAVGSADTALALPAWWRGITFSPPSSTPRRAPRTACGSTRTSSTGVPDRRPRAGSPPATIMLLIPAIDLKDGRCVRLRQGDMDDATVFSEDPVATPASGSSRRAPPAPRRPERRVRGKPKNEAAIRAIVDAVGAEIPVQIGGGIRDLDTIERYLDGGIAYVIIGTAAVKNPGFLHDACGAFPGQMIVGSTRRTARSPPTAGAS